MASLQALPSRRDVARGLLNGAAGLVLGAAPPLLLADGQPALASGFNCPGLNGYALSKCLKVARKAREEAEAAADEAAGGDGSSDRGSVQDERLKYKQYEQPGTLVTLPSGLQYREIDVGTGREAVLGATCEIRYVVYRLSPGAYFKYSSGGTPVFLFALGFGFEGEKDEGEVYRFRLGDPMALPAAVTPALLGMREGGRRRVLVPPRLGWTSDQVGPRPSTFGGQRRLIGHKDEPLLFEAALSRVRLPTPEQLQQQGGPGSAGSVQLGAPFRLPAPPSPFKSQLGLPTSS